jgi:hypothetical protein
VRLFVDGWGLGDRVGCGGWGVPLMWASTEGGESYAGVPQHKHRYR